jgi:hypothetical protein
VRLSGVDASVGDGIYDEFSNFDASIFLQWFRMKKNWFIL